MPETPEDAALIEAMARAAEPWRQDQSRNVHAEQVMAAEITALRAELADARLQIAGGDMLIHAANLERDALAARLAVPGEEGFAYQVRRAEWRIIRYNLDQYGMRQTGWDDEVLATWPTRELAVADMPNHGYEHKHVTGRWIPHDKRHDYEEIAVMHREVVVPNLLTALRARVAGLEGARVVTDEMVERAAKVLWRDYGEVNLKVARAALDAALSPSAAQEARDAE